MKIGIADSQARVRFGLRVLLEQQPGWKVIGEAADSQKLLSIVMDACPDLVLVDWDFPDLPVEILLPMLKAHCPSLRVVAMSGKQELRQKALQAGADLFAYKADPPEKLLGMIRGFDEEKVGELLVKNSRPVGEDPIGKQNNPDTAIETG